MFAPRHRFVVLLLCWLPRDAEENDRGVAERRPVKVRWLRTLPENVRKVYRGIAFQR